MSIKTSLLLIFSGCVIGAATIGVGFWSWKQLTTPSPITFRASSETIVHELRQLNRLETASFTIEKIIEAGTNGNAFQKILYGDQLLLIAHGQVIAGIDLAGLDPEDMRITNDEITLMLPAPQILITALDNQQTRVYDRKLGLLTKGNKDLEAQARQAAEAALEQAACEGMILEKAGDNARSQLTTLLKSLGFAKVSIEIPAASCS